MRNHDNTATVGFQNHAIGIESRKNATGVVDCTMPYR
jgi:hypothetical protein